jgi:hypothetical protein
MATTKWIRCVNEDDIHVAGKLQVLKSVVENEPLDSLRCKPSASSKAICPDAEGDSIAQSRFQKLHFVARPTASGAGFLTSARG